jgi:MoaA/NifB/PqqE/SkfB family radical SAM enzyme
MLVRPFARTRLGEAVQWRLQTLSLHTGLNLAKPTFVCLKLTMRCNARCRHCLIYQPEHTPPDELTAAEWRDVLGRLRRWLGPRAPLTVTGGEILMRRDAFEVLESAADREFALHLLTNGWLASEERVDRLMRLGARTIQVSLDGADPSTHDFIRGIEGFGLRTRAALQRLVVARERHRAPTKVVVAAVIFRQNLGELASLVRLVTDWGVDAIKFQPIEQTYMESEDPWWFRMSPLWVDDPGAAARAIDEIIALKNEGFPIQNAREQLELYKRYFADPAGAYASVRSHDRSFGRGRCRTAVSDFDMSSNGDVRLCYRMSPIGNLRRTDPEEIWNRRPRCWRAPCPLLAI